MSGKGLQDLDLKEETAPSQEAMEYDSLPDFGSFAPPPQPGTYGFVLPSDLSTVFETFEVEGKGTRVRVLFDQDAPLTIYQSPGNAHNGESFHTRISNAERKRGSVEASDGDYLLRALKETTRPAGNRAFCETLQKHAGEQFHADLTYSWYCNPARDIYVYDAVQDKTVKVDGRKGCGAKYYQADKTKKPEQQIKKLEDGTYPYEVSCACGAVVRAFANLDNIRA